MTYAVFLHPKAAQELNKLETGIRARIVERAMELRHNPAGIRKSLRQSDFRSLRVGEYRAIYRIDLDRKQVVILFVGHRGKVYDDFSKMI